MTSQAPARPATVGEIAAAVPGATAVFRRFGLDFCCKGNVALADSARQRGVDPADVERALAALDGVADRSTAPRDTPALIDHILARYHDTHRRELPELIQLARKVEKVHAKRSDAPRGLADLLRRMAVELEQHMAKEELILFPAMKRSMTGLDAPIACMRHEHDGHGEHLGELAALTNQITLPADACRTWQALYAGLAKLSDDLMEHIHLENNVLFPRFSAAA
jgi:regulator of cell morphogenesis and NO signaling